MYTGCVTCVDVEPLGINNIFKFVHGFETL